MVNLLATCKHMVWEPQEVPVLSTSAADLPVHAVYLMRYMKAGQSFRMENISGNETYYYP